MATNNELVAMAEMEAIEKGLIQEGEALHTFQEWKRLGYVVRKGEHALCSLMLWRHKDAVKGVTPNGEEVETEAYFYGKKCYIFSTSQVEHLKPNND